MPQDLLALLVCLPYCNHSQDPLHPSDVPVCDPKYIEIAFIKCNFLLATLECNFYAIILVEHMAIIIEQCPQ